MRIHQVSGKWRRGVLLSLTTAVLWGILPIVLKVLLEGMDAFTIVWYRFLGATFFLSIFIARRYGVSPVVKFRGFSVVLTLITILGLGVNYVTYALGIRYTSPGISVVLIQIAPIFMLLGGIFIFRERFRPFQWGGLGILILGMVLFFNRRFGELLSGINNLSIGAGIIVLSALFWAAYALAQKQLLRYFPSEIIMVRIYIGGTLLFLPLARPEQILALDPVRLGLLAFCALNTLVAYGCFSEALDHLEASRVSLVVAVTPLVTLAAAAAGATLFPRFVSPEKLNLASLLGAFLVVAGSMLGSLKSNQALPPD